ncbi:MAG: hypothetical protein H6742_15185 [Alphaproteobacteria bacterium]|nr:hypothetical protein [Alphaproteobacteria bacterium]
MMRVGPLLPLFLLSAACIPDGPDGKDPGSVDEDADGDGYSAEDDCDDNDPSTNPGAEEIWYDGVDQDCAGGDDYDADGDGERAVGQGGADCDDSDHSVNPGAADTWYDCVDSDCDGNDGDQDGDGYVPDGYAEECDWTAFDAHVGAGDCFDDEGSAPDEWPTTALTPAEVGPEATETWYDGVDQDCDGASDYDADGDGDDAEAHGGGDCDDADPARASTRAEIWYDGIDQDCGLDTDFDADADGFLSADSDGAIDVDGSTVVGEDCDDSSGAVSPDEADACGDDIDADCDGDVHDCDVATAGTELVADSTLWLSTAGDLDGDGVGDLIAYVDDLVYPVMGPIPSGDLDISSGGISGLDASALKGVAAPGDVDGDGSADLWIAGRGAAEYVRISGPMESGGSAVDVATATLESSYSSNMGVWTGGDVTGDGVDDLVFGVDSTGTSHTTAFLVSGTLSGDQVLEGGIIEATYIGLGYDVFPGSAAQFGSSASLGDMDGDGIAEVIFGDSTIDAVRGLAIPNAGGLVVFAGGSSGTLDDADFADAGAEGERLAISYAFIGDTDDDGYGDLAAGTLSEFVQVYLGGSAVVSSGDVRLYGEGGEEGFGESVRAAGDVDGDGSSDVLVVASSFEYEGVTQSRVDLFTGPLESGATPARQFLPGHDVGATFHERMLGPGDIDGDGLGDIIFGVGGTAWVFSGGDL